MLSNIQLLVLILVLVYAILIFHSRDRDRERFTNSGLPHNTDFTQKLTTQMDYRGSMISSIPSYPNNLISNGHIYNNNNTNNTDDVEKFTPMNPYIN